MGSLVFEWDENKNKINIAKHGISFKEASTVFYDDDAIIFEDKDHSEYEERFLMLGMSSTLNTLMVCHCYRGSDNNIRIISARKANKKEQKQYYEKVGYYER